MRLNEIFITEKIRCRFLDGLNIILGKNHVSHDDEVRNRTSDTNGIGKTLIVSSIKHVLKGDVGSAFGATFFCEKRYWAQLWISTNSGDDRVLLRPLWAPLSSEVYFVFNGTLKEHLSCLEENEIDLTSLSSLQEVEAAFGEIQEYSKFNDQEYSKYLSRLESIDYSTANLSLSSLLDYIIRDEKFGFNDPVSIPRRTQWVQYRAIQYLFGLPAFVEQEGRELSEQVAHLHAEVDAKKQILNEQEIKNFDTIENKKAAFIARLDVLQKQIAALRVGDALESIREDYNKKRTLLSQVSSELTEKENHIRGYQSNLEELKLRAKALTDLLGVKQFYEELKINFPTNIADNFQQFEEFFNSVSTDRKEYYTDLIRKLQREVKTIQEKRSSLAQELDLISARFQGNEIVSDIALLTREEADLKAQLARLDLAREALNSIEALEDQIEALQTKRREMLTEGKDSYRALATRRGEMIQMFHQLLKEVYKTDDGLLEFEFISEDTKTTAGRTEVNLTIPSQESHGRTYSRVNIFDLIWFLRERDPGEFNPNFLIHDGSYAKISRDVKPLMLRAIASRLGSNKQYIITLNEGELQELEEFSAHVCCTLDGSKETGKFFHEQFG